MGAKKQLEIAGTERPNANKEVDTAAEDYQDIKKKRMKLTEKEVEAKGKLIEVMRKHELSVYEDSSADPPLLVTLDEKFNVKVKELGEDEPAEDAA